MKKYIAILLCVLMLIPVLAGCSATDQATDAKNAGEIKVVTTIFPIYDWVREIVQDDVHIDLDMLLDNGVDLHSYQPTAQDMLKIAFCDMFIYVGGESDGWVDDALSEAVNTDMVVINLLEELGDSVKEEELVEGMQEEDEHDHEHHHDEDDDEDEHNHNEDDDEHEHHHHDEDEVEYDEHVY